MKKITIATLTGLGILSLSACARHETENATATEVVGANSSTPGDDANPVDNLSGASNEAGALDNTANDSNAAAVQNNQ